MIFPNTLFALKYHIDKYRKIEMFRIFAILGSIYTLTIFHTEVVFKTLLWNYI